jgi:hypothetical protein
VSSTGRSCRSLALAAWPLPLAGTPPRILAPKKSTSPLETRVGGAPGCPSGRSSRRCIGSREIATGCHQYAYETALGRSSWPNRDPIGEKGGANCYALVENQTTGAFDALGMEGTAFGYPAPLPNMSGYGPVHHQVHEMDLFYTPCCDCTSTAKRLYEDLKSFSRWGVNSVADVNLDGTYGLFLPATLSQTAAMVGGGGTAGFMVSFSYDDATMCVSARTLLGHPLTGIRKWCVERKQGEHCKIQLKTEAYEQYSSALGYLGAGIANAREAQSRIWNDYFQNIRIAETVEGKCMAIASDIREVNTSAPGRNPWLSQ